MVAIEERTTRTIINQMKHIDPWFWCRYTLNPYQGCEFSCTYCDARSHRYHLHSDFEQKIVVKRDAALMLDKRISRSRSMLPDVVCMSGVCDPYQPIEREWESTRSCLRILEKHGWPVHVITKSPLVVRDLDILERIARRSWATVSFTVTTPHAEVAGFLEPKAPEPVERIEAVRKLKENAPHVQTGVLMIPIVPFLEDREEDIDRLVRMVKEVRADFMLFSAGMTMRDDQAVWFLKELGREFPDLVPEFERLYGFSNVGGEYSGSYEPDREYTARISRMVAGIMRQHEIPYRIPRYLPDDHRRENYRIAEKLLNRALDERMKGEPWKGFHWAGMNIQNLKRSIVEVGAQGELGTIRGVAGEVRKIVEMELSSARPPSQRSLEAFS